MKCSSTNWLEITDLKKEELITKLTSELVVLRAKAKLTQEEIAKAMGISRQTYSQIESGKTKMSWNMYLSLILFFSSMADTCKLLDTLNVFPHELMSEKILKEIDTCS